MIALLCGRLVDINGSVVIVNVGGVGYEVEVTTTALSTLGTLSATNSGATEPGPEVTLHTHMVVREDAQLLYGFASRNERDLFRALIRINSVGPKLALSVLSALSLPELARAVAGKDLTALTKISGVGRKTAERLLMELKDKMESLAQLFPAGDAATSNSVVVVSVGAAQSEALTALVGLGYKASEVAPVLESVSTSPEGAAADTEELVRLALRYFYRQSETG
jgi:Holliday junction DNA helicase RuvA